MEGEVTSRRGLPDALPPLSGWAWLPFLALCATVLGFSLYGAALYIKDLDFNPKPETYYGLQMRDPLATGVEGDGAVVRYPLGREADALGIHSGDRVIAINGRPLGLEDLPVRSLVGMLGPAAAIDVTLAKPDGERVTRRLTRSTAHVAQGWAPSGLSFVTNRVTRAVIIVGGQLIVPLILAALLLLRRPKDALAPWLALSMLLVSLAVGPAEQAALSGKDDGGVLLGWAVEIAMPVAGWMQIAVLALFPDAQFRPRWTWAVVLGSVLLAYWIRVESTTTEINAANFAGVFVAIFLVWTRYRAMPAGTGRQQIRLVLFGFAAAVVASALLLFDEHVLVAADNAFTYVWAGLVEVFLSTFVNLLLFIAMTLGLMRYRLYDADAAISRSVVYGGMTLGLLAVFAGSEKVIEILGEEYFGHSLGVLAGALGAAVAAVCIGPIHHRVTHWAEERFRSGLAHLRHGLPILLGDMRDTATPAALADAMLVRVEKGVRARHGAVVVRGTILDVRDVDAASVADWLVSECAPDKGPQKLQWDRADPLFPMRVPLQNEGFGLVGWLLLGPRPDGSSYGREERTALRQIAEPAARALAIALERERRDSEVQGRIDGLQSAVDGMRRIIRDRFGAEVDSATLAGTR